MDAKEIFKNTRKQIGLFYIKKKFGPVPMDHLPPDTVRSIVILGQERFGDLIMITPLIRALRLNFPEARIGMVGVSEAIEFLRYDKNLDFICNIKRMDAKERREIWEMEHDIVFNPKDHPSFTFLYLTLKINARLRVGISHSSHHGYFSHMIEIRNDTPAGLKNLALLDWLRHTHGKDDRPYLPDGPVSESIRQFSDRELQDSVFGINLSASQRYKEWPQEYWQSFLMHTSGRFVVFAMPDRAADKAKLEAQFPEKIMKMPPTESIFDAGHVMKHLDALITTDTAMVHIASCFNTPVFVMYRLQSDLNRFPPLSDAQQIIIAPDADLSQLDPRNILDEWDSFRGKIQ